MIQMIYRLALQGRAVGRYENAQLEHRGLGNPRTIQRLRNNLRDIHPQILFLMETKISAHKMEKVRRRCGFIHSIGVSADGSKGGLCLGRSSQISVTL